MIDVQINLAAAYFQPQPKRGSAFDADETLDADGYPVIAANRVNGDQLKFFCRYCDSFHLHGGGNEPGDGDGHRAAHCVTVDSPYHATGYVLRETSEPVAMPEKRYRRKYGPDGATSGLLAARRALSQNPSGKRVSRR